MFDLSGKVALVTGAARGMGKAHAISLASQGATVVVTDADSNGSEDVAESIRTHGHGKVAKAYQLNVADRNSIDLVISEVVREFGRLDILINNAGIYQSKPVLDITEDDWNRMMAIDLSGTFWCAQRAARAMVKNHWGRIINISSISSGGVGIAVPASVHYTTAKAGVIGMTEALAIDLAPFGILVNAIAPGGVDTPMSNPKGQPRSAMDEQMASVPLKRIGTPEEISAAVIFLASNEASYVTGTTIYVDGGWLAG